MLSCIARTAPASTIAPLPVMNQDSSHSLPLAALAEAGVSSVTRAPIPARHFEAWLVAHVAGATIGSFLLVYRNASDEPYISFRGLDAFFQVGVGCALILIWIYLIAGTLYGVATGRLSRGWLWLLPWAAFVLFYLRICPQGYIEDILNWLPKSA